jgi:leucyl-tRNA synthetase
MNAEPHAVRATATATAYDFRAIERRWQTRWRAERAFQATPDPAGPTYFALVFPPYPNGRIHMGHVRNYTIGDALARYKRMTGHAVLHPIGFDAFGLPNEMEAARQGLDPAVVTVRNIKAMRSQLKALGYSYDWRAMLITINPRYYRWNQWLFSTLVERDLAYRKEARIQWCPGCRTSLANEQVLDGRCWRCEQAVVIRYQAQWFFRFQAYADEMWVEAEEGSFPPNIAAMLKEWIRRMPGAELIFPVIGRDGAALATFTTKPELSYGARYLALSPEHPFAAVLVRGTPAEQAFAQLRDRVRATDEPAKLLDGIDTGTRACHPLTGEAIPIWVAAHVDSDFGTGAVMGNPCHDRQDHAFGREHGLPGKAVAGPPDAVWNHGARGPYLDDGVLRDSGPFTGRLASDAREDVIRDWEARGIGRRTAAFGLRDWLVSRQRAWGVPIPVIHCRPCGPVPVPARDLPVRLPKNLRDTGGGNPLLARPDFVRCRCPRCGSPAERETDTMDTFLDTAWYYLRCTSPRHPAALCDPVAAARWGPADLYIGGIEIAVPIMLYGSFVTKALRDAGLVDFSLPSRAVLAHEMVLKDGRKMSKSLGNTVDPMTLIDRVGADAVRFVILSLAPPLKKIAWSDERLQGCHKFLTRVWALGLRQTALPSPSNDPPSEAEDALVRQTHEAIRAVTLDLERLQPNTCLTALIKFLYALEECEARPCAGGVMASRPAFREAFRTLLVLLAPFTPHLCEELWERLGLTPGLSRVRWPRYDPAVASGPTKQITVKVNDRTVARLDVAAAATKADVLALAYGHEAVQACLRAARPAREIYIEDRMLNLVT